MLNRHSSSLPEPLVLIVPGSGDRIADQWESLWKMKRPDCLRLDLGRWEKPHRNNWINVLNLAVRRAERPVVLVAQGLSCPVVAWWAEYERPHRGDPVVGALFIAPPDVDRPGLDPQLARLHSCPRLTLPFPSYLIVGDDDPDAARRAALTLARDWGSGFVEAAVAGGDKALGLCSAGERTLQKLLRESRRTDRESMGGAARRIVPQPVFARR